MAAPRDPLPAKVCKRIVRSRIARGGSGALSASAKQLVASRHAEAERGVSLLGVPAREHRFFPHEPGAAGQTRAWHRTCSTTASVQQNSYLHADPSGHGVGRFDLRCQATWRATTLRPAPRKPRAREERTRRGADGGRTPTDCARLADAARADHARPGARSVGPSHEPQRHLRWAIRRWTPADRSPKRSRATANEPGR